LLISCLNHKRGMRNCQQAMWAVDPDDSGVRCMHGDDAGQPRARPERQPGRKPSRRAGRWRISGGPMADQWRADGRSAVRRWAGRWAGTRAGLGADWRRCPRPRRPSLQPPRRHGARIHSPRAYAQIRSLPTRRPSGPAAPRLPTFWARSLGARARVRRLRTSEHPGLPRSPPRDGAQVCGDVHASRKVEPCSGAKRGSNRGPGKSVPLEVRLTGTARPPPLCRGAVSALCRPLHSIDRFSLS